MRPDVTQNKQQVAWAASVWPSGTREMGYKGPNSGLMPWSSDLWLKDFHVDQVCISVDSGMKEAKGTPLEQEEPAGLHEEGTGLHEEGTAACTAPGLLSCKTGHYFSVTQRPQGLRQSVSPGPKVSAPTKPCTVLPQQPWNQTRPPGALHRAGAARPAALVPHPVPGGTRGPDSTKKN